jgi:hypothetical protein
MGRVGPHDPIVIGRGVAAFRSHHVVTVVDLTTGQRADFRQKGKAGLRLGVNFARATVSSDRIPRRIPFLSPYRHVLPTGYRWVKFPYANRPIMAVPRAFRVVEESSGGDWRGVKAIDLKDLTFTVNAVESACGECDNPVLDAPALSNFITPYSYGPTPKGQVAILPDLNGVLDRQGGTEHLIVDLAEGGDISIVVTGASRHAHMTQTILHSVWYP